jgi:hypothetical protein
VKTDIKRNIKRETIFISLNLLYKNDDFLLNFRTVWEI